MHPASIKKSNWKLSKIKHPVLLIGDETLKLWPKDTVIQVEIFPSLQYDNLRPILDKLSPSDEVEVVCLAIGFHNRKQSPEATSVKALQRLIFNVKSASRRLR